MVSHVSHLVQFVRSVQAPWNDIVPEDNKDTAEPAKVIKACRVVCAIFQFCYGKKVNP